MTGMDITVGGVAKAAPRTRPGSKAHVRRVRDELNRAGLARDRFSTIVMEYLARNGWDWPVPADYRETWKRLDAEYLAAVAAWETVLEGDL